MKCPICSSMSAECFQAKYVKVAKCPSLQCGHIWAVGVPAAAGVQSIEDPDGLIPVYSARNQDLARFFWVRGFLKPNCRLLDMGAGSGHLARALRDEIPGIQIVAVEADPRSLSRLKDLGFDSYPTLDEVPGAFDAINLVEVIEHLDDPTSALIALRKRLRHDGKLFCTTPCGETRRGRRDTNAYDTPEHVQFFTERSLALCFRNAGFKTFQCETINAMTSRLTPVPSRYLKDLLRPIRAVLWGHQHLTGFAEA